MAERNQFSKEYKIFKELEHWRPLKNIVAATEFVAANHLLYGLFCYLYIDTKELYAQMPLRKNGEKPFIHPLNVVMNLKKAGVNDVVTLCAGLIHDYVEERVDLYKEQVEIKEDSEGIKKLDAYEKVVLYELQEKMSVVAVQEKIDLRVVEEIIAITKLLTRHKRDFYYKSIIGIFQCRDEKIREKAMQVKLADRTHNIWSIENFTEQQRLFQCFKNLFIINNVKLYLMEKKGKHIFEEHEPLEKLLKKCGKATYDAFLYICRWTMEKGITEVTSMMQLAFQKFSLERNGMLEVTNINRREKHPLWLFQGVIRKYDAKLLHHFKTYEKLKQSEFEYCTLFFSDYKFTPEQIKAIVDYKDAYSLKEAVAYLLYKPDYMLGRFNYQKLFRKVE
ncbi:hypothetical protein A2642_01835 [Candidatus Nomurabacteria bacterium RIFCSPHIGHO2_01_FULL_39_10]|uniref:Uncharacterized protein n=1 Tax=Candidatus Nomurabacteria bacterium RIFCSPHIGHO2_01_FULL_39_10 TaxID=1801733 RepID=A0A1F6V4V3_9BACT|nr:MAG: hypothetical protein A2642_01835 [Candidatus Nomurabacteria bacterium RIFCSPHIGHO2_01_FULL_39_10]